MWNRRPDGARPQNLVGEEPNCWRHRGEPIKAPQHVVDMAFGRDWRRARVPSMRRLPQGQDTELRQMAKYLANRARDSGIDQQLGPLNPRGTSARAHVCGRSAG